ncbi:MAG: uroporphyrinogen decarboxylase family protein, partial [Halanaerobiales bacterium]
RKNQIKAYTFKSPERIPINMNINKACYHYYKKENLEQLMSEHKLLFPNFKGITQEMMEPAPWRKEGIRYEDSWGCIWKTDQTGITGSVIERPLDTWDNFQEYPPPDPREHDGWQKIDWNQIESRIKKGKEKGDFVSGGLRHGFLFLTLSYIRGYENLIYDMYEEREELFELIDIIKQFNKYHIEKYIELGVDMIGFPEDLGTQDNLMISPDLFKKYIKPVYQELMKPVKENGILIHMHSDGYIMDLMDDIIDCGVDIINPQDLVNGIDNLKKYKNQVAINLDIDRQRIVPGGTPEEIDKLIEKEVKELGSKKGGLSLTHGLYPGVPLENIEALMKAMEKYSCYYN